MSAESAETPVLEVRHLRKAFPGVQALDDVQFDVRAGEVHAVMGENGAGKSTLMKILAGLEQPDQGQIRFKGEPRRFRTAHEAMEAGIAMIHQELMPFPDLSIAENIFMGREPAGRWPGWIAARRQADDTRRLLGRLGVAWPPETKVRELSVSGMQLVEIAKAIARRAEVIIMDEPTSALSAHEIEVLFQLIGDFRRRGVAVIYITHKLDEVFRLADRVTVLRDGRWVSTDPAAEPDGGRADFPDGRPRAQLRFRPGGGGPGRRDARGAGPDEGGEVPQSQLRRPPRRDPGHRRPDGRGPHGGAQGDLRAGARPIAARSGCGASPCA